MSGIVEFLRARLDEDEAVARAATRPPWRAGKTYPNLAEGEPGADEPCSYEVDCRPIRIIPGDPLQFEEVDTFDDAAAWATVAYWSDMEPNFRDASADAEHIARHDPARVLREVEAKREVVDGALGCHEAAEHDGDDFQRGIAVGRTIALRCLAAIYADHPDYRDEWE